MRVRDLLESPAMQMPANAELAAYLRSGALDKGVSIHEWREWLSSPQPISENTKRATKRIRAWAPYRSKWELDYAHHLELLKLAGRIRDWSYEPDRLEIGEGARYTPDFRVELLTGATEYHEVKGYRREAAMVRIRVAAKLYPQFRFVLVTKKNGAWNPTRIGRAA